MQVWTVTRQTEAGMDFTEQTEVCMDIYWIDRCWYGQLLGRLMQVWTVTGQTDAGMNINWID